jgi:hypothetical protein
VSVVVVALLVVTVAALLHAADLARQDDVQRAMDGVLTRRGRDTLDELSLQVREHRHVLGAYHARACVLRDEGRHREALERMTVGCRAIEELTPEFLSALHALRHLARSVSVIVAVDPIEPRRYATPSLGLLAGVGQRLHDLLVTGKQRVLLRLRVAGATFRLALHWLRRVTVELAPRPADVAGWGHLDGLVADLGTAGDEALIAAHQIIQALDAVELGCPAVHPDF